MTTHKRMNFLHSCVKIPIDPCNNCPAPVYNRPNMYLGRLTATPQTISTTTTTKTKPSSMKTTEFELDLLRTSSGVRSLAKFYDSIPDYCEIHHLPEEEFYSTLDTLRTTCRELKTKSIKSEVPDNGSTTTNSSLSSHCTVIPNCTKKTKYKAKKKSGTKKNANQKKFSNKTNDESLIDSRCASAISFTRDVKNPSLGGDEGRLGSFKKELEKEINAFKKTLKDYEDEFKQPVPLSEGKRIPTSSIGCVEKVTNEDDVTSGKNVKEDSECASIKPTFISKFNERLKKSFSHNDIQAISDSCVLNESENNDHSTTLVNKHPDAEYQSFKDSTKMSNYFKPELRKIDMAIRRQSVHPKIVVESPSSKTMSSTSSHSKARRKKKSKSRDRAIKPPFCLFDLHNAKEENITQSTATPVYPVARPNLAATLRVEVSKQKKKELQNNCTFYDTTPHFDWEVRKTPAWKSLSLNESHKQILSLRLATRKAEQELQRREYELNMELMRQRVKSAPLLLEGPTFWGPKVGKLTHNCQREGMQHSCECNQRKHRKKHSKVSRCSGGGASNCGAVGDSYTGIRLSNKINTLRKIYANSAKSNSRNSHHSSTSHQSSKRCQDNNGNDDDDLSSVDRAYL